MQPDSTTIHLWTFINSFAGWLSALGTIAAVITALYLSRKEHRVNLEVSAGVRIFFGQGVPQQKYLYVEVVNIARRPATVTTVCWTAGPFRKQQYWWDVPQNRFSSVLPVTLVDGETARWMMPLEELPANFAEIAGAELSGLSRRMRVRSVKVTVSTSTGEDFHSRLGKDLREKFLKILSPTRTA
jgi:hypothetical protein